MFWSKGNLSPPPPGPRSPSAANLLNPTPHPSGCSAHHSFPSMCSCSYRTHPRLCRNHILHTNLHLGHMCEGGVMLQHVWHPGQNPSSGLVSSLLCGPHSKSCPTLHLFGLNPSPSPSVSSQPPHRVGFLSSGPVPPGPGAGKAVPCPLVGTGD